MPKPKHSPHTPWVGRRTFLRSAVLASGGLVLGARPARPPRPVAAQGTAPAVVTSDAMRPRSRTAR
jgi:hypothetical protein